jgi:hypothetical protein
MSEAHKLAAILAADVGEYSRPTAADEDRALVSLDFSNGRSASGLRL